MSNHVSKLIMVNHAKQSNKSTQPNTY